MPVTYKMNLYYLKLFFWGLLCLYCKRERGASTWEMVRCCSSWFFFLRISASIELNRDLTILGCSVVCTRKHLDAAPSPRGKKLEHEQATDDTLTPRGNCNDCDTIHTHTHTALSNCSLVLESKQCSNRGLNQRKQRDSSQMDWKDRNRHRQSGTMGTDRRKEKISFQVPETAVPFVWFTFKLYKKYIWFLLKHRMEKWFCVDSLFTLRLMRSVLRTKLEIRCLLHVFKFTLSLGLFCVSIFLRPPETSDCFSARWQTARRYWQVERRWKVEAGAVKAAHPRQRGEYSAQ